MRLTVKERILLHLLAVEGSGETLEVPKAITQEGIAEATWIRRRHLSQYIGPLVREDLVAEEKAHVIGIRQKRKVYKLTTSGKLKAVTLREKLLETVIRIRDEAGTRELSVAQALSEAGDSASLLEIVRRGMLGEPVPLVPSKHGGESRFVTIGEGASPVNNFVGRRGELAEIVNDPTEGRLIVIRGVAGIGKSSLAGEAWGRLKGRRNRFWHRVRAWDTKDSLLARLGSFLKALGKPGLRAVLQRGETDQAADVIHEDLSGTRSFLVFDDVHEAGADVLPFFRLLVDALSEAREVTALVLTRRALTFYNRRDVVLRRVVEELELQGLESHDVAAYLGGHGMPARSYDVAQQLHGHPLFLELLRAHNPFSATLFDIRQYLEEEVYADLPKPERGMMKAASLYGVPVPRRAFLVSPEWSQDVFLALRDRSLLRAVGKNRFEVHDTIRDFFADLLTPEERGQLSRFAVQELRLLAAEAKKNQEFSLSSGYLSDALRLSTSRDQEAELSEALGDVSRSLGDRLAVSVAYRAAAKLATDAETASRARRKMADELFDKGELKAAAEEVNLGLRSLADRHSVEGGWLHLTRSRIRVDSNKPAKAKEDAKAALASFEEFGDLRGQAEALVQLSFFGFFLGMREEEEPSGRDYLESALELSDSVEDPELAADIHLQLIHLISIESGDEDQAAEHFAAIEALPGALESYRMRRKFLASRVQFHSVYTGNSERVLADLSDLMRIGRQVRDDGGVAQARYQLAAVALSLGNVEEARNGFEEAGRAYRSLGIVRVYGNALFHAGQCYLMQGDAEGFRNILRLLEDPDVADSLILYPKIAHALARFMDGETDDSRKLFEELLREVKEWPAGWGSRFDLPRIHLVFGTVLRAMGREREGAKHIDRAQELYESGRMMGMLAEAEVTTTRMTEGLRSIVSAS